MTDPIYSESNMYIRTRTGFRKVGTPDDPVFIRTRTGWRPYPAIGDSVQVRTRDGWQAAVTGA